MRSTNASIVERRWPALRVWLDAAPPARVEEVACTPARALRVDGIQLESAYDPRAEAELQGRLVPEGARSATLYGFAQGSLARVLLRRAGIERLRVVILNPSVARASLERFEHADWLADERVELVRAGECADLEAPFSAAPACLRLASEEAARLRDLVVLELATPHIRRHRRAQAGMLAERIEENRDLLERDGDVAELFGSRPGATIRVAAAGPTLAEHFRRLRDAECLIAVDAALRPLLAARVVPDLVVTMDAHPDGMRRVFDVPPDALGSCTLVYSPVVLNEVLARWPGPRLAFHPPEEVLADARRRWPRGELWSSGSVVHPAIDLAVRMGARRIELHGADFATPGGRSHVAGCAWEHPVARDRALPWVLDGHGRRVESQASLIGYLRDLERYVAAHPEVELVNASRAGAAIAGTSYPEEAHVA